MVRVTLGALWCPYSATFLDPLPPQRGVAGSGQGRQPQTERGHSRNLEVSGRHERLRPQPIFNSSGRVAGLSLCPKSGCLKTWLHLTYLNIAHSNLLNHIVLPIFYHVLYDLSLHAFMSLSSNKRDRDLSIIIAPRRVSLRTPRPLL